jgi:hypothetical protein
MKYSQTFKQMNGLRERPKYTDIKKNNEKDLHKFVST